MPRLDKDERELLRSVEAGEWLRVAGKKRKMQGYQNSARDTLREDQRVNIRITRQDLEAIRKLAMTEGISYQTLIASVLHKYVAGRLREQGP